MTRRDLQLRVKSKELPWEIGKDVEQSGPVGEITPASQMGHPQSASLWLKANGEYKQKSDISQMILPTPGDIVMTGTPAGIGPAQPGDVIEAGIGDLPVLKVRVVA